MYIRIKHSAMKLVVYLMLLPALALTLSGCSNESTTAVDKNSQEPSTALADIHNYHPNPVPFRGNLQRTGVFENTGTPKLDKLLWTTGTRDFADGVVVEGGLAYYMVGNYGLHAIDTTTGKLRWVLKETDETLPTVQDGVVYYTYKGTLHAVEAGTQQEKWVFQPGSEELSSLLIVDNVGYLGDMEGQFFALDLGTGKPSWTATLSNKGEAGSLRASFLGDSPVTEAVVLGGRIYFGSGNGYVYALDAVSGKEVWSLKIGEFVTAGPSVGDGVLYFIAGFDRSQADVIMSQDNLYAVGMNSGKLLWHFEPPHVADMPGTIGLPVVGDGVVYCANSYDAWLGPGHVYAFDAKTGNELWEHTTADQLWDPKHLALFNGLLYVSARQPPDDHSEDAPMYVLDAKSGEEKWTFRAGSYVTEPVIADGVLYIGSGRDEKGTLHALDPASGKELRNISTGAGVASTPFILDGIVYLVTRDFDAPGDSAVAIH